MHKETFYTKKDIKDFRLAVFSDLHYYPNYPNKVLNSITNQIKKSNPDYILILGDILDSADYTDLDDLRDFLATIANIAPVIAITGNHDQKAGHRHHWRYHKNEELIKILNSIKNIHLIDNDHYLINNINFHGIILPYEYYDNDEKYEDFVKLVEPINYLEDNNYNITLIHTPINIYDYLKKNKKANLNKTDLILSGHMHNGILPYWFTNIVNKVFHTSRGIISPNMKPLPKYSQGRIYERDGYIYQGIAKLSKSTEKFFFFDRFFVKKIVVIDIKKHQ